MDTEALKALAIQNARDEFSPMHPRRCAECARPMLHTCEPHVMLCYVCRVALGARP